MKIISRLTFLSLLLLGSCKKFQNYLMVPSQHRQSHDCVYHNYGKTPHCKRYHLVPVDKKEKKKEKQKPVADYQQYKGAFNYTNKSTL